MQTKNIRYIKNAISLFGRYICEIAQGKRSKNVKRELFDGSFCVLAVMQ